MEDEAAVVAREKLCEAYAVFTAAVPATQRRGRPNRSLTDPELRALDSHHERLCRLGGEFWCRAGCDHRRRVGVPGWAATVHLGGTLAEIAAAESAVAAGRHPERPFVLLAQQTPFDASRAPAGKHTAWAYCHVPNGSTVDMTAAIEAQVERFAPGFRDRILARSSRDPAAMKAYDENYVGGDINGGSADWRQLIFHPVPGLDLYATPSRGIYLCSSSTPPGGGVHGMSGHLAARSVLRREFGNPRSL
jgi:phytoene dehydrogenase-like protein